MHEIFNISQQLSVNLVSDIFSIIKWDKYIKVYLFTISIDFKIISKIDLLIFKFDSLKFFVLFYKNRTKSSKFYLTMLLSKESKASFLGFQFA